MPTTINNFRVHIDGFDQSIGFTNVTGFKASIGTEDVLEGGENTFTHKLPKRSSYGNLTLKRGVLKDIALYHWFSDALNFFEFTPKKVTVSLLDVPNGAIIEQWIFVNAWPISWSFTDLDSTASGNSALMLETVELTYQYFYRVDL